MKLGLMQLKKLRESCNSMTCITNRTTMCVTSITTSNMIGITSASNKTKMSSTSIIGTTIRISSTFIMSSTKSVQLVQLKQI